MHRIRMAKKLWEFISLRKIEMECESANQQLGMSGHPPSSRARAFFESWRMAQKNGDFSEHAIGGQSVEGQFTHRQKRLEDERWYCLLLVSPTHYSSLFPVPCSCICNMLDTLHYARFPRNRIQIGYT
jgi:hypothetical protein